MSARITFEWDTARWDDGVAQELIVIMMDALWEEGRVAPDSAVVVVGKEER